ncbi:ComEA family DNA-binding protein [Fluviicoccus keumensis]|nr:ComEA family DNA-binding protein [Fluviicoccus keumensis]
MRNGSLFRGILIGWLGICGSLAACEPAVATGTDKVNINTADAATLASKLKGVGQAKAEAIVRWRSEKGKFTNLQQLDAVKGFGPALIDSNRDRIAF